MDVYALRRRRIGTKRKRKARDDDRELGGAFKDYGGDGGGGGGGYGGGRDRDEDGGERRGTIEEAREAMGTIGEAAIGTGIGGTEETGTGTGDRYDRDRKMSHLRRKRRRCDLVEDGRERRREPEPSRADTELVEESGVAGKRKTWWF